MKNNSKYTKNKEKWLDIYNSCKCKLYQFKKKIITIFVINQTKNIISSLRAFKKLKIEKLTILDKYILKNFIFTFLSVLSVITLVIVGRTFVKLLETVIEGSLNIEMIVSMLFLSTLRAIILLLPFSLMISLIISLSKLHRDGEIYAIKASGNYKTVFTKIFYLVSISFFIIIFTLNMFGSPYIKTEVKKIKREAIATSEIGLTNSGKFIQMKNKNWVIFVEKIEDEVPKKIFIKSSDNSQISIETAEEGREFIENGTRRLVLKNGQRYTGTPGTGNFQVMKYDEHEIKLVNNVSEIFYSYKMKSIFDLIYDNNKAFSSAEIQWRLSFPLSTIVLILFAFILGEVAPRQNKYSNLIFAIIIYFIYSNLVIISINEVQKNSNLFSFIGAWWVHILALLSCYLLYLIKKLQIKSYKNLIFYIKNYKR